MKTIMITGGSSGIGKATALSIAQQGHHVIAIGRNKERLAALRQECGAIDVISADITTELGISDIHAFIKDKKIDVLINNAGLMTPSGNLLEIEFKDWQHQMSINVGAPLFLSTRLIDNLSSGRILNLTVYASFNVNPGLAAYGVSKAALNMLTEYMRNDFKDHSVSVGLTLPGIVDTNIQNQLPKNSNMSTSGKNLAEEGKLLSPNLVAKFISWLVLHATNEQFGAEKVDIYDDWHHKYWSEGQPIKKP